MGKICSKKFKINGYMIKNKKFLVTGGGGFLGRFVVNKLVQHGVSKNNIFVPSSSQYNLVDRLACQKVVRGIDIVIHLAAKVGGIGYNQKYPGSLFYGNIMMGVQLMEEARKAKVSKFVAVGTVCAYPKHTPIPFKEEDLWSGYPEETNAPYGLAKKMLLVQAQAYRQQYSFNAIYFLLVNLYGPGDNFNLESSHVIPALIKKIIEAKSNNLSQVTVWGTGTPTREFLYVEDAAEGIVLATEKYDKSDPVNLGSGVEISIRDLAETIKKIIGYDGVIVFDKTKPDGQPRRKLDVSKASLEFGFRAKTDFNAGLRKTIEWYLNKRLAS